MAFGLAAKDRTQIRSIAKRSAMAGAFEVVKRVNRSVPLTTTPFSSRSQPSRSVLAVHSRSRVCLCQLPSRSALVATSMDGPASAQGPIAADNLAANQHPNGEPLTAEQGERDECSDANEQHDQ